MKTFFFLIFISFLALNCNAQLLKNDTTTRSYLSASTTWTQEEFNEYNNIPGMYQIKLPTDSTQSTSMILRYPELDSVHIYWANGVWNSDIETDLTTNFNTLLMVSGISHTVAPQVAGATTSSATVTWNSIPGVTQYRFRIRPQGGFWNVSTVTGTSRTINTLLPGTTYNVVIRVTFGGINQGEYSQIYSFTTPSFISLPTCNAPSVTGSIVGNQLTLSWNPVAQATGYQIQMRQLGALSWGGTTTSNTFYNVIIDTSKAYEYQIRTACTGTSSSWSVFTVSDTLSKAVCTPPTGLYNVGNTFYWDDHNYTTLTQFQHRLVGNTEWGGTSTTGNSVTNNMLWGQHEWRVRSRCYATTSPSWTGWTYGMTNFIPKPQSFEQFDENVMYPNPANDVVNLKGKLILTDLFGRVILSGMDILDVSHLSNGVYLLNNKKLIVQH